MTAPAPIVPRSDYNPARTTHIQRRVNKELRERYKSFTDQLVERVEQLPHTVEERKSNWIQYNAKDARRYIYSLDDSLVAQLDQMISELILRVVFDNQSQYNPNYYFSKAAELGYRSGMIDAIDNFEHQMPEYPRTVQFVLQSKPYRDRIGYIGARSFEDFKGFNDSMKTKLRLILTNGMASGRSPLELARRIRTEVLGDRDGTVKGAARRAENIARTEINQAHRRARLDEQQSALDMGINAQVMHVSALIPGRTRKTHAERHGKIVTVEEEEEWYSKDGNAVNCLCTTVSVLTDEDGKPLNPKAIERQRERRKKYLDVVADDA